MPSNWLISEPPLQLEYGHMTWAPPIRNICLPGLKLRMQSKRCARKSKHNKSLKADSGYSPLSQVAMVGFCCRLAGHSAPACWPHCLPRTSEVVSSGEKVPDYIASVSVLPFWNVYCLSAMNSCIVFLLKLASVSYSDLQLKYQTKVVMWLLCKLNINGQNVFIQCINSIHFKYYLPF